MSISFFRRGRRVRTGSQRTAATDGRCRLRACLQSTPRAYARSPLRGAVCQRRPLRGGRVFFIYFLSKASFIQFAVLFHLLGGFEDVDHLFQINGTRQPFRTDSRFKRASPKFCRLPLPLLQLPHSRTPALPLPLSFPLQPRTRVRVSAAFLSLSLALSSARLGSIEKNS